MVALGPAIERALLRASRGALRAGVTVAIAVTILLLTQAAHAAEISVTTEGRPDYPAIILNQGEVRETRLPGGHRTVSLNR
jgi:hypothetical protein